MSETEPHSNPCAPSLQGKAALVTGAAGGIGSAIVSALRTAGASVLALDIKANALGQAFDKMDEGVSTRCCDATREDDVQAAVAAAVGMFGRIDVLVNGVACDEPSGTIVELSPAVWDQTFAANVRSAFLMSRAVVPVMARSGGGSIVHIASQLGRVGTARRPAYCATKGALIQLAKAMAIDHAADHIRVNALSPGAVGTGRLARRYGDLATASAALGGLHLLGRLAEPREIACAALFLASDQAGFITGSDFLVDGGYSTR